jgi:threonine dehydrogenase-like Zn-dependent dehydrogenase
LGGRFHRSRIRLISSQVSSLSPDLTGRWSKARRFSVAWEMLRRVQPARWITHRFALQDAAQAYELLDQHPELAIQVVFTYP